MVMQGMSHNAGIEYLKMLYFLLRCYLDLFLTFFPPAHVLSSFTLQVLLSRVCHSLCDCTMCCTIGSQVVFPLGWFLQKKDKP